MAKRKKKAEAPAKNEGVRKMTFVRGGEKEAPKKKKGTTVNINKS